MKVLYIFRSLAVWGGIERVFVDKMNNLTSIYGVEVYMLTTCQGDHRVPYHLESTVHLEDLGIQFHRQYQYRGFRRIWDGYQRTRFFEKRLSKRLMDICPDVIICTTSDPVNSIVKVKGKIPLVVESHSICSKTFGEKGIRQRHVAHLLMKGLKKASCVVALTEGDAMEWRAYHPVVMVIPNIVHLNEGNISNRQNKRVIWVGRFDYQKRPLEIVKIWQQIHTAFPNWHLDIYGEGVQKQELQEAVSLQNTNIHLHEPTNHIFEAYRNSSILVVTSLYEPFGLVIPEAMSCGLPVISYDSPFGPSSLISDGNDGFLVEINNQEMFINRLCKLMHDESLREYMGMNALESSKRFSPDTIMPKWETLFSELCSYFRQGISN